MKAHAISIRHKETGEVLFKCRALSMRHAVEIAVRRHARMSDADLRGVDLRGASLGGADLEGVDLTGAYVSGAYLESAFLNKSVLAEADLTDASLACARLREADLSNAVLVRANLTAASFYCANLSRADLTGACLDSATFDGADLPCIKGFPEAPVVKNIDNEILKCLKKKMALDMEDWHGNHYSSSCSTTHCRAGFAIHLAGQKGYALEKATSSYLAGRLIYEASRPGVPCPDFFASNSDALADIEKSAKLYTVK